MPRILLISRENEEALKTYGVKKVPSEMKFHFIIGIVIALICCFLQVVDSRIVNERQYLEYLNDLDRRNVEFDDIHQQWPFYTAVNQVPERDEQPENQEENVNREMIAEAILAKELANRHNKNYRERVLENLEEGFKHMRETTDRADHLSQYRRHKPLESDLFLEPIDADQMENIDVVDQDDEERKYDGDDNNFPLNFEKDGEEVPVSQHQSPIFTSFPRLVIERNNFEHKYPNIYGNGETEEQPEEEEEEIVRPKPTFSPSFFPRLVAPDFKVGIHDLDFGTEEKQKQHHHDDYIFKEGEEFPHTIDFDKIPVVDDPTEFALGPADPRFNRDIIQTDKVVVTSAPREAVGRTYLLKTPSVSKPKMNSRSDLHQLSESLPNDEKHLELNGNKDVEVVPYKPDMETDTAGVYLIAIVAGISAAASVGLIAVGIGWYNLHKHMKNAEDSDYPSYGIVGPNKDYEKKERNDAGDRKLAQSAQMYHYQHQKQQIIAMGRNNQGHGSQSESDEEEDEEGNYTVYECPGLASIEGPLEVKNPMFDDDQLATPSLTPSKTTSAEDTK